MLGLYKANRIDNEEEVIGNLICIEDSPFVYILTKDNFDHMIVDELNDGKTKCKLIRVMKRTVEQVNYPAP